MTMSTKPANEARAEIAERLSKLYAAYRKADRGRSIKLASKGIHGVRG
jgi:hypothetical protein